jgi:hypothetical protein
MMLEFPEGHLFVTLAAGGRVVRHSKTQGKTAK